MRPISLQIDLMLQNAFNLSLERFYKPQPWFLFQGGSFVIVPNYTGDRLNYGLGMERAVQEGIKIGSVVCGEDCATTSSDKSAGRRGLAGIFFIIKVNRATEMTLHVYTWPIYLRAPDKRRIHVQNSTLCRKG